MKFKETELDGAYLIELAEQRDERGFFARAWCEKEFRELELSSTIVQANISFNRARGTLRGLHYQRPPFAEVKLVRCTRGAIVDVIVDLEAILLDLAEAIAKVEQKMEVSYNQAVI